MVKTNETRLLMNLTKQLFPIIDPFVLNGKGELFCRSPEQKGEHLGWVLATKTKKLIKAGQMGIPLEEFKTVYRLADGLIAPPTKEPIRFKGI